MWEGDGLLLLYKCLESGSFQWPRSTEEAQALTPQQYRWLMEGLMDHLSLMANAVEAYAYGTKNPTVEQVAVKAHDRKEQSGNVLGIVPEGTPTEVVEHRLCEGECVCDTCGAVMEEIGKEVRRRLKIEQGRTSTSKSYMWVYRTSGCAEYPIVLYEYQPSRKAEYAQAFLKNFSGWLHADGYQGYHKLPENIRVVGCWAHARRKFDKALQTLPKEKWQKSLAATGECYCTWLFQLEQSLVDLTPEERYNKRLELEKPVLDALLAWANEASAKTAPKSTLGKALHYLQEQWPYLVRYLEDGRLEFSNNRAERSIKPFVMDRKNWLFSNTPAGSEPDFTRGTLEGDIAPGEITFYRLQCDSEGALRSYIAQGEMLPVATRSFGGIGIFAIPEMGRFYRHVLIQKRYPHHGAVAFSHCGKALFEVLKYFGVSDIAYNQPKNLLYPTGNPFQ